MVKNSFNKMISAPVIGISRHRILRDGNGITTLVGLNGCPLKCKYCINRQFLQSNMSSNSLSPKELLDIVKKDDIYFRATSGGIVFGGGEPLLHSSFIKEFQEQISDGWEITVETSLNVDSSFILSSIGCIDEYIIDIKDWNDEIYYSYTNSHNHLVKQNLKILAEKNSQESVMIKLPYIPGYNTIQDVTKSEKAIRSMGFERIRKLEYQISELSSHIRNQITGKQVCKVLKYVRQTISKANGIEYSEEKCSTTSCSGTCPKCEMYLKKLTQKINNLSNPVI